MYSRSSINERARVKKRERKREKERRGEDISRYREVLASSFSSTFATSYLFCLYSRTFPLLKIKRVVRRAFEERKGRIITEQKFCIYTVIIFYVRDTWFVIKRFPIDRRSMRKMQLREPPLSFPTIFPACFDYVRNVR